MVCNGFCCGALSCDYAKNACSCRCVYEAWCERVRLDITGNDSSHAPMRGVLIRFVWQRAGCACFRLLAGTWSSAQTLFEGAFEHRRQVHLLTLGVFVHAVAAECDVLNHGVHTIRSYVRIRQITVCEMPVVYKKSPVQRTMIMRCTGPTAETIVTDCRSVRRTARARAWPF